LLTGEDDYRADDRSTEALVTWIQDVTARLDRGEFDGHGPIALRDGTQLPDTGVAIRIMLADLQHQIEWAARRRAELLADFAYLRAQLG
jgi:hypothetical protein